MGEDRNERQDCPPVGCRLRAGRARVREAGAGGLLGRMVWTLQDDRADPRRYRGRIRRSGHDCKIISTRTRPRPRSTASAASRPSCCSRTEPWKPPRSAPSPSRSSPPFSTATSDPGSGPARRSGAARKPPLCPSGRAGAGVWVERSAPPRPGRGAREPRHATVAEARRRRRAAWIPAAPRRIGGGGGPGLQSAKSRSRRPGRAPFFMTPSSFTTRRPLIPDPVHPDRRVSTRSAPAGRSHLRTRSPRPTVSGSKSSRSAHAPTSGARAP